MRFVWITAALVALAGCQVIAGITDYETGEGAGGTPSTGGSGGTGGNTGGQGGATGGSGGTGGAASPTFGSTWIQPTNAAAEDTIIDVARDGDGDPVVLGRYAGNVTYAGTTIEGGHGYVARLDRATGGLLWRATITAANPDQLELNGIAASDSEVVIVGNFLGNLTLTGAIGEIAITPTNAGKEGFVARFDVATGTLNWALNSDNDVGLSLLDVAVNSTDVVVVGHTSGLFTLRNQNDTPQLCGVANVRGQDGIVLRINPANGNCGATDTVKISDCTGGEDGSESVVGVAMTEDATYVTGSFSADLDGINCTTPAQGGDVFVAKLDNNPVFNIDGNATLRGPGLDFPTHIAAFDDGGGGHVAVMGTFVQSLDGTDAVGNRDVFVQTYDDNLANAVPLYVGAAAQQLTGGAVVVGENALGVAINCNGTIQIHDGPDLAGTDDDICLSVLALSHSPPTLATYVSGRFGEGGRQIARAAYLDSDGVIFAGENAGTLSLPAYPDNNEAPIVQTALGDRAIGFVANLLFSGE